MDFYVEILGYTGTVLIVISMMMSSVLWLRVVNICGSVFSATYSAISSAWPIVLLNVCLIVINGVQIVRYVHGLRAKKREMDSSLGADKI